MFGAVDYKSFLTSLDRRYVVGSSYLKLLFEHRGKRVNWLRLLP